MDFLDSGIMDYIWTFLDYGMIFSDFFIRNFSMNHSNFFR